MRDGWVSGLQHNNVHAVATRYCCVSVPSLPSRQFLNTRLEALRWDCVSDWRLHPSPTYSLCSLFPSQMCSYSSPSTTTVHYSELCCRVMCADLETVCSSFLILTLIEYHSIFTHLCSRCFYIFIHMKYLGSIFIPKKQIKSLLFTSTHRLCVCLCVDLQSLLCSELMFSERCI